MTVYIDTGALAPIDERFYFRRGALSALSRLQDAGFRLVLAGVDNLTREQQALLEQEGVLLEQGVAGEQAPAGGQTLAGEADASSQTGASGHTEVKVAAEGAHLRIHRPGRGEQSEASGSTGPAGEHDGLCETWPEAARSILNPDRSARVTRRTRETDIAVELNLDGDGHASIDTGLGFYDHMLEQIARHGAVSLSIQCQGDLHVDEHHTIEDVALALGQALARAVGDKRGTGRYGFVLPMDEARAMAALDFSGRPYLVFEAHFDREMVGDFPTEMTRHFFHSLAIGMQATLHVGARGENDHHKIEAMFKGVAVCLRQAVDRNERYRDVIPSSKGTL